MEDSELYAHQQEEEYEMLQAALRGGGSKAGVSQDKLLR